MKIRNLDISAIRSVALTAILSRQSVQELFDSVYEITALPMICFDTSFRHIAHVYESPFYFNSWVDIVNNGSADEKNIVGFGYLDRQEMIYSAGEAIYIDTGRCEKNPSTNGAILVSGELAAYCGIMTEDCSVDDVLEITNIICKTIPIILDNSKSTRTECEDSNCEATLTEEFISRADADKFFRNYPGKYYFVVLSPCSRSVPALQYVKNYIKEKVPSSVGSMSGNNNVYILFYNSTSIFGPKGTESLLVGLGQKYDFQISISGCFNDPYEIPLRRKQAALTMSVGRLTRKNDRLFSFEDMCIDIITFYANRELPHDMFITDELKTLLENFGDSGLDYLCTLYEYLLNFRRFSLTAKRMGLHKNTIIYRIKKISDLLGVNFRDERSCNRLLFSLVAYATASGIDFRKAGEYKNEQ